MTLYGSDRARRSLFDTIGFRALSQLASVAATIVLVRGISEVDFGAYSLLYALVPLFATFGSLGLDQVVRRFQPELLQTGQVPEAAWLVRTAARLRLMSNLLLIAVLLAVWPWVAPKFGFAVQRSGLLLFAAFLLLYFQVVLLQFALSSLMLHRFSMGAVAVVSMCKLAGYALLSSAGILTLQGAISVDLAAHGMAFALLVFAYRRALRQMQGLPSSRPGAALLQRVRGFAKYSYANDAASLLVYPETDRLFIASLLGPLSVGAYAFYARLVDMAANFSPMRTLDSLIQPLFFAIRREDAAQRVPRYFTLLLNMGLAMQLPMIVFAAVFHADIVQLVFGGKFLAYSPLLPLILALATTELVVSVPVTLVAQYKEQASIVMWSQIFGLYQFAAMLLLIPLLGLAGAALATGSFHLLRNAFVWIRVRDLARWSNATAVLSSVLPIWGAAFVASYAMRRFLQLPAVLELGLGAGLCLLAFLAHLRSPAICLSDRSLIGGLLQGRWERPLRLLGLIHAT